jgi:hypothetical protein
MTKLSRILLEVLTNIFLTTVLILWIYDLCEEDSFGREFFGLMGYVGTITIGVISAASVLVFLISRITKLRRSK